MVPRVGEQTGLAHALSKTRPLAASASMLGIETAPELPVSVTGQEDFVARFTGKLNVANAGPTEFLLMSNDGAAMQRRLLPGLNAKDKNVRFRVCQLLALVVGFVGEDEVILAGNGANHSEINLKAGGKQEHCFLLHQPREFLLELKMEIERAV